MRQSVKSLAFAAALAASPAAAQVNLGLGAQANVGAGVGADAGGVLGGVTGALDGAVGAVDRGVNGTLAGGLRIATAADVAAGGEVRDAHGRRIGTVSSLHGNMAVVVQGGRAFHVPLAGLYRGSSGLVTSLTAAQLQAGASVHAHGRVNGGTGY